MKQFKTRDSATAFLRKRGVKKEHYNNFITADVVDGKPVFMVDDSDVETYISCDEIDRKLGTNLVKGNFDSTGDDGKVTKAEYHNDDAAEEVNKSNVIEEKKVAKKETKSKAKASPLAESPLDKRSRERLEAKSPKTAGGKRVKSSMSPVNAEPGRKLPNIKPTNGILNDYPDAPTNSIRGFIMYLILERIDDDTIYAAMLEVFGKDRCEGKRKYPYVYRRQLAAAGQLDSKGKPKKH